MNRSARFRQGECLGRLVRGLLWRKASLPGHHHENLVRQSVGKLRSSESFVRPLPVHDPALLAESIFAELL